MMNPPSNVSARGLNSHQAEATGHSSTTPVPGPSFSPPEVIEPPPQQAPTPAGGNPGYRPPDSAPATEARHKLYPPPPPPVSPVETGEGNTGIKQRLCSAKELEEKTHFRIPLGKSSRPPYRGKTVIITRLPRPTTTSYFRLLIY